MDNLRLAYKNAKRGKGWYKEVREIEKNVELYLNKLQALLVTHTYRTSEYEVFYKKEGHKVRKIYKLPFFPDRIAQWAILQVIEPYFIRTFIYDTYSAIPKRGIHVGLKKLQHELYTQQESHKYCLQIDIRHYYQNINHTILKQKLRKLFKDPDLLIALDEIIDSVNTIDDDDIVEIQVGWRDYDPLTGVPIGNYLSQYLGNFYLSEFDHWMKEQKHQKSYRRYMDDGRIFAGTKEELFKLKDEIEQYLWNNLKLRLKSNWQIFPTYIRGVDFLGYRIFDGYTLVRKSTANNMKRKLVHIYEKCSNGHMMSKSEYCSCSSYHGLTCYGNSYRLSQKYLKPIVIFKEMYYNRNIKPYKKGVKAA